MSSVKPSPSQIPLDFEPPRVRKTDPRTSHEAALGINITKQRQKILDVLNSGNYATFQIAERLNTDRDSVSPHMKPLERLGLVRRTGQTVKKPAGRNCEIWQKV